MVVLGSLAIIVAMLVAAGLALASAVAAGIMVEGKGRALRCEGSGWTEGATVPA